MFYEVLLKSIELCNPRNIHYTIDTSFEFIDTWHGYYDLGIR